jgi:hypothetical protein
MLLPQISTKAILLLLGCVIAMVCLTGLPTASAQEKPTLVDSENAKTFRKDVIDAWNWEPNGGVSLTTTEYALDYVGRYDEKKYGYLTSDLHGLVLFQTATHDIPVFKWGSDEFFLVIERSSGEIAASTAGHRYGERMRFVDVDGAAPVELQRITNGTGGTGLWGRSYRIYDLTGGFDTMLEVEGYTDDNRCPDVQPRFKEPDKDTRLAVNDISKTPKVRRFRMQAQLRFASCEDMDARPEFVLECRFDEESRTFECEDTFVTTVTLTLKDLEGTDPQATAKNIRWVLSNADELRESGFRFPKGFLEKLPRRLPEGSGD